MLPINMRILAEIVARMPTINDARLRKVNDRPDNPAGLYVLYWTQMARRLTHNHALDFAIHLAHHYQKPLVIYEGLKLNYPWASARIHTFMLQGMKDNVALAAKLGVSYWPFVETPDNPGRGLVKQIVSPAVAVVTDDYPAYIVPAQIRALAMKCPVSLYAVDTNSVVPLSLLGKIVGAAAHLRPRIHKLFPDCWPERANPEPVVKAAAKATIDAPFPVWQPPDNVAEWVAKLPFTADVPAVRKFVGGSTAGHKKLAEFVTRKLSRYAEERNNPDDPDVAPASGLSPWLHFGHIGIEAVVAEVLARSGTWSLDEINRKTRNKDDYFCRDANVNSFLDEAITWRDVGHQWHQGKAMESLARNGSAINQSWQSDTEPTFNFETMDFSPRSKGTLELLLPEWAFRSLSKHATDRREYVYSLDEFESAATHDDLWNAAQTELVKTGVMNNYLRMLWAKKVLEWSASPEDAYRTLEHLNNKYAIDGRDPNSYTGILWCFGLFDRPWAPERDVFGVVRYMSSDNTARKFKLGGYYEYVASLSGKRLFN
jgi:deoxyribodipyrimidine photo-lyase